MKNDTIILFGATGDLAQRKLIPAIYQLVARGALKDFLLIGAAYESVSPEQVLNKARPFITHLNEEVWQTLLKRTYYHRVDFRSLRDFYDLSERITTIEKNNNVSHSNRLLYLATAAHFFIDITEKVSIAGIANRTSANAAYWHRIVYEKPFGHDLESAHAINTCIANYYGENQIYRIDHYLTKELVNNIALMRFANTVFEPLWNNNYIDEVQIILAESVSIEGRGSYYDAYGALLDVVQNHMLELLAIIAMEAPEKLSGDYVRSQRARVLKDTTVTNGILGQYNGYTDELNVKPDSKTDTFAALTCTINNDRWKGVPFYLKTGKCLEHKETTIYIKFKVPPCILAQGCPLTANWLHINIAPKATFTLTLNTKHPGQSDSLASVPMEFSYKTFFGNRSAQEAYEILLEEIIKGDQSVSVRFDEIESSWRIIDETKKMNLPLYTYQPGSHGPQEITIFEKNNTMNWKS